MSQLCMMSVSMNLLIKFMETHKCMFSGTLTTVITGLPRSKTCICGGFQDHVCEALPWQKAHNAFK